MSARAPSEPTLTLNVAILGRDFKVACKESERAELLEAVALLDGRMREIRDSGKIGGAERIAVMAALNIANELLRERKAPRSSGADGVDVGGIERRIRVMSAAIESTLAGQDKLL